MSTQVFDMGGNALRTGHIYRVVQGDLCWLRGVLLRQYTSDGVTVYLFAKDFAGKYHMPIASDLSVESNPLHFFSVSTTDSARGPLHSVFFNGSAIAPSSSELEISYIGKDCQRLRHAYRYRVSYVPVEYESSKNASKNRKTRTLYLHRSTFVISGDRATMQLAFHPRKPKTSNRTAHLSKSPDFVKELVLFSQYTESSNTGYTRQLASCRVHDGKRANRIISSKKHRVTFKLVETYKPGNKR